MAEAVGNMSLDVPFGAIVSAAWRDLVVGKHIHFQSQNHADKKHLKLHGDGTVQCDGGKGKPATWIVHKGKDTSVKFESVGTPGAYLKVNAKGEYTTGPGGGEPCMFHVNFLNHDNGLTCTLKNVKFTDGNIGVKPNGEMKAYGGTGEGPASHFLIQGGVPSAKWFQLVPKCNEGVQLNVYEGKGKGSHVKCWDDKTNDNGRWCLNSVNKRQHRLSPKHQPMLSMNVYGGINKEAQVVVWDDAEANSMFHAIDYDGTWFRIQCKGSKIFFNCWGGNGEQGCDIKMYDDKHDNSLFRVSF